MIAEFRLLFHGWPDVYLDGDMGGAFLVRLAFGDPRHSEDRHDLPSAKASSPLASPTAGLRGLSMALSFAGLAPSPYTAPLPRWRLRKFSIRWTLLVLMVATVESHSQVDSTQWSQSTRLLVLPTS